MADFLSIISANYKAVGAATTYEKGQYKPVDKTLFEGTWTGKYAKGQDFTLQISNVVGFRARVSYTSGIVRHNSDVLIKDGTFRIGDTKFFLSKVGGATIRTVVTDSYGAQSLESAPATKIT